MKHYQIKMTDELNQKVKIEATLAKMTMNDWINMALEEKVAKKAEYKISERMANYGSGK